MSPHACDGLLVHGSVLGGHGSAVDWLVSVGAGWAGLALFALRTSFARFTSFTSFTWRPRLARRPLRAAFAVFARFAARPLLAVRAWFTRIALWSLLARFTIRTVLPWRSLRSEWPCWPARPALAALTWYRFRLMAQPAQRSRGLAVAFARGGHSLGVVA